MPQGRPGQQVWERSQLPASQPPLVPAPNPKPLNPKPPPLTHPLQSLTADLFEEDARGRAFGTLYLTGALGGMAGALFATNMGGWCGVVWLEVVWCGWVSRVLWRA